MPHNIEIGRAGEARAARHLHDAGYRVIERNWRCSAGEIDIVAVRGEVLAIVEVKTRTSARYGHPFESVDRAKTDRLWRLGVMWARSHADEARGLRLRVDAVAITGPDPRHGAVEHLRGIS